MRSILIWDWLIIASYFAFIILTGYIFKRVIKSTSDYFRGGGNMLWWVAGVSGVMGVIGSFVFTGGAAKMYKDGTMLPILWVSNIVLTGWLLFFVGKRYRRMRVITAMEGVRRRYGPTTEQMLSWFNVVMSIVMSSLGLLMISVFMASILHLKVVYVIWGMGLTTMLIALAGGSWSVAAANFVQGLVALAVLVVMIFLVLQLPEIGGVSGFFKQLPERHFDFTQSRRASVVWIWFGLMVFQRLFTTLNMAGEGARWLTIKDEKNAFKMAILIIVCGILTPWMIAVAPMASAIVFPVEKLAEMFPNLKEPAEGAVVAMAYKVMPAGILGVLIVAIFATELSTLQNMLNMNSGILIKNIYCRIFRKNSSDKEQLVAGKITTVCLGLTFILIATLMETFRTMDLFDFALRIGAIVGGPIVIPMAMGIVIKRTPGWSAWSTVLVGITASLATEHFFEPQWLANLFHWGQLSTQEATDVKVAVITGMVTIVPLCWFLFTMLFYKYSSAQERERIEEFYKDLNTPIEQAEGNSFEQDQMQYKLLGILCMIYGGTFILGILMPVGGKGRLCFVAIGTFILGLGACLYRSYLRLKRIEELGASGETAG